jgi:hypothetical protein
VGVDAEGGCQVSRPTGYIRATRKNDPAQSVDDFDWEWQDGDVVWISSELLEDAIDGIFSTRSPGVGEEFTIGPYRVRCTRRDVTHIEVVRV